MSQDELVVDYVVVGTGAGGGVVAARLAQAGHSVVAVEAVPRIASRYFDEGCDPAGDDLAAVVAGVRFVRGVNAGLGSRATEIWPGPEVDGDEQLADWVRDVAWGHHACGTCAIGRDNDPYAVLDSRFRVRGVPGLRVVDASVFPVIPGYFLVSSVSMVAEKAADVILADAGASMTSSWPAAPVASASSPSAAGR